MIRCYLVLMLLVSSANAVTYELKVGWNLFSPILSSSTAVSAYFETLKPGVLADIRKIWSYQSGEGWSSHTPGGSTATGGQFDNLEPGLGYWVLMDAAHSIELSDSFNSYNLALQGSGWKLIGMNSSQEIFLDSSDFLQQANFTDSSADDIRKIWGFDGVWKSFSPADSANDLTALKPGYGFWFLMLSDLEVNSQNINLNDLFPPACPGCPSIGN